MAPKKETDKSSNPPCIQCAEDLRIYPAGFIDTPRIRAHLKVCKWETCEANPLVSGAKRKK